MQGGGDVVVEASCKGGDVVVRGDVELVEGVQQTIEVDEREGGAPCPRGDSLGRRC